MRDMSSYPAYLLLPGVAIYLLVMYLINTGRIGKSTRHLESRRTALTGDDGDLMPYGRDVLYAMQFKSVTTLGALVGPALATAVFGWLPVVVWLVVGASLVGWAVDYSSLAMSAGRRGFSTGSAIHELLGNGASRAFLIYATLYLLIANSVFMLYLASLVNSSPFALSSLVSTAVAAVVFSILKEKRKWPLAASITAAVVVFASATFVGVQAWLGFGFPSLSFTAPRYSMVLWAIFIAALMLFPASLASRRRFLDPMLLVTATVALGGLVLIVLAIVLSPLTEVPLRSDWFKGWTAGFSGPGFSLNGIGGPIIPLLLTAAGCGAISGWNGLVNIISTGRRVPSLGYAQPAATGAMMTQAVLALAVVSGVAVLDTHTDPVADMVAGSQMLLGPFFGEISKPAVGIFYITFTSVVCATALALGVRQWRLVTSELFTVKKLTWPRLRTGYLATVAGALIPLIFVAGSPLTEMWLLFGAANIGLAGLILLLAANHLRRLSRHGLFLLWPGVALIAVSVAGLAWVGLLFGSAAVYLRPSASQVSSFAVDALGELGASAVNVLSLVLAFALVFLVAWMAVPLIRKYLKGEAVVGGAEST